MRWLELPRGTTHRQATWLSYVIAAVGAIAGCGIGLAIRAVFVHLWHSMGG